MKITIEKLDYVLRCLAEVGYNALPSEQQEICNAYDNGTLDVGTDKGLDKVASLCNFALAAKAKERITGDAGDMSAVLPGLEDHVDDDVPLFGWRAS